MQKPISVTIIPAAPGFKGLVNSSAELMRDVLNGKINSKEIFVPIVGWRIETYADKYNCHSDLVFPISAIGSQEVRGTVYPNGYCEDGHQSYPNISDMIRYHLKLQEEREAKELSTQ